MQEWLFLVEFSRMNSKDSTTVYIYEVLWSVPTAAYPEPQVTVSVFFCIETSIFDSQRAPRFPEQVTYIFEGNQFVHRLGMAFQPKWLFDILDMKTMTFKSLLF
ncbi:A-kinase anchor protein 14-like [Orussus abietinus]|uniref:A-kinase anchor protein 14-like n=1 Tax=Orussus abietinus TaxID=222816 RepID=UPI000C715D9A|nr:A-kinase anchor protein 14-like [Orussus abietinus]